MALSFDCPTEAAESLKRDALRVIEDLKQDGAAPELIKALKEQRAARARAVLTSNQYWLDELVDVYRRGHDPRGIATLWRTDAGLDREALKESARRYLRVDQYVDAVLLPEQTERPR